jgi:hypothetical protein
LVTRNPINPVKMKKFYIILGLALLMAGTSVAESNKPKPAGKHRSHKKAKKKSSKYFFNFQH